MLKWCWHKLVICWCYWYLFTIEEADDSSILPVETRKVPKSLEEIVRITKFSKSEIRLLYKGFKQVCKMKIMFDFNDKWNFFFIKECPNGAVTQREFQAIYSHFFPHGNCQNYTSFLFRVLDRRKRMYFTFEVICSYKYKNN